MYCSFVFSETLKHHDHEIGFLVSGRHSYKFEYTLPTEIPSSFDMEPIVHARVQYTVKAQLESPIRVVNQSNELGFYVIKPLDLREDPYVIKVCVVVVVNIALIFIDPSD